MQGGQLAAAGRLMPLLVPFTTMAALKLTKTGAATGENMFSDRPAETLNAIMAAIQSEITAKAGGKPTLAQIGVASFSSGIYSLEIVSHGHEIVRSCQGGHRFRQPPY
jgi:hypothetical protein